MLNFPLYRTLLGVDGQFIISCGNTSWLNHHLKEFLECADKWICHIMYGDVPSLTPIVQTHSSSGDMWRGLSGRFMTFITIMIFREGEVLIGGLQKKKKLESRTVVPSELPNIQFEIYPPPPSYPSQIWVYLYFCLFHLFFSLPVLLQMLNIWTESIY